MSPHRRQWWRRLKTVNGTLQYMHRGRSLSLFHSRGPADRRRRDAIVLVTAPAIVSVRCPGLAVGLDLQRRSALTKSDCGKDREEEGKAGGEDCTAAV